MACHQPAGRGGDRLLAILAKEAAYLIIQIEDRPVLWDYNLDLKPLTERCIQNHLRVSGARLAVEVSHGVSVLQGRPSERSLKDLLR